LAVVFSRSFNSNLIGECQRGVIFRLGRINGVMTRDVLILPVLDQSTSEYPHSMIEPQETVTADSVTIKVNAVLYYRILIHQKLLIRLVNLLISCLYAALNWLYARCRAKYPG